MERSSWRDVCASDDYNFTTIRYFVSRISSDIYYTVYSLKQGRYIKAKLTRLYLTAHGTSDPSERVFSPAEDIVTAQHLALSPENADILIFLKKNMAL